MNKACSQTFQNIWKAGACHIYTSASVH